MALHFGLTPALLGGPYETLVVVVVVLYEILGIEPMLAMYKANALPTTLSFQLLFSLFLPPKYALAESLAFRYTEPGKS